MQIRDLLLNSNLTCTWSSNTKGPPGILHVRGSPMVAGPSDTTIPIRLVSLVLTLSPRLKGNFFFFFIFKMVEAVGIEPTSATISSSSRPQACLIFLNQQMLSVISSHLQTSVARVFYFQQNHLLIWNWVIR